MVADPDVEVRRSARRKRTLTVFRERGRLVALVPARLTIAQERALVPPLVERFLRREAQRTLPVQTDELAERARRLHDAFLAPRAGLPLPAFTITWVGNQQRRWGSCSPASGRIRLSSRLRTMPLWVSDYVIVHELAHLFVPTHSAAFHELVSGYPELARAEAFLQGYQFATDGAGEPWPDDLDAE